MVVFGVVKIVDFIWLKFMNFFLIDLVVYFFELFNLYRNIVVYLCYWWKYNWLEQVFDYWEGGF